MANLQEGQVVKYSGVGSGVITGFSDRGYPQVDGVTVSVLELEDGTIFNPHSLDMGEVRRLSAGVDAENYTLKSAQAKERAAEVEAGLEFERQREAELAAAIHKSTMAHGLMRDLIEKCEAVGVPVNEDSLPATLDAYIEKRLEQQAMMIASTQNQ